VLRSLLKDDGNMIKVRRRRLFFRVRTGMKSSTAVQFSQLDLLIKGNAYSGQTESQISALSDAR
jgi:hypothetical protein